MAGPGTETSRGTSLPALTTTVGPPGLGVIGNSIRGPAFVPVSLGDLDSYVKKFGHVTGDSFGSLAAQAWLQNTSGCTFIRLLGSGDGKKRITTDSTNSDGENISPGAVTNSGFVVGERLTGSNGFLESNPFAVDGGLPGRTYFIGTFMSDSAGSSYLSNAGIKGKLVAATAGWNPQTTTTADYAGGKLTITDGSGTSVTYLLVHVDNGGTLTGTPATGDDAGTVGGTAGEICVQLGSIDPQPVGNFVNQLVLAINSANGNNAGVADSNIILVDTGTALEMTQVSKGPVGNRSITREVITSDAVYTVTGFTGGSGGGAPILRGVLFAASGVLPALSGCYTGNASTASIGATVGSFANKQDGGSTVGSINISKASDRFVLLLNGHTNTNYPNTITASFNSAATDDDGNSEYFVDVLNTDPAKIRETGHYLYSHFHIPPSRATITGSGIVVAGKEKVDAEGDTLQESVFLLTSSIARNANDAAGSLAVPNFENFCDRFTTAQSPWVFSQYIQRKQHNLFKFHALDDGIFGNNQVKITISNIIPAENDDLYGSFDVTVRSFQNIDEQIAPLSGSEEFVGCTLDPSSDFYIAKVIGDRHFYFDFEKPVERQKFVRAGDYENRSSMVRVEMSKEVREQTIPKEILPVGFRGPKHLVISGSSILSNPQHPLSDGSVISSLTEWGNRVVEPPIPYRLMIGYNPSSDLSAEDRVLQPEMCWGLQTTIFHIQKQPNSNLNFNQSVESYTKYFPAFTTGRQKAFVGDNTGVPDSNGTVYDSDRYNNNKFTLENILIHTRSDADIVDNTQWAYAKYVSDRIKIPLIDSTLSEKSGVRFFDVKKDLSSTNVDFAKFTLFLQGGFDGVNIFSKEKQKFANLASYYELTDPAQGGKFGATCGAYFSALRMMQEESEADINLLALPGMRVEPITNEALNVAQNRYDAFYVMDIQQIASGSGNIVTGSEDVSPSLTAENFRSRALNNSFAAVYFPDISMVDPKTSKEVFTPPSISAIRVYSKLDAASNIHAPAGGERGIIDTTAGSSYALQPKVKFNDTQKETVKTLYDAAINPIIESENGLVLFGQRTLLTTADSMLQRISVRRMLLEIRRQCRMVAKTIIFEQNKEKTLKAFQEAVTPILVQMANAGGISRYKVKIDTDTTTQADIEANTVRGKVFLQPKKSDEIIQVDFST